MSGGEREFLTVVEVANRLMVSRMTVYRLCSSGELRHNLISGRTIRVPAEAVEEYLRRTERGGDG